jgi:4-amino-4-deoxy-L-arabinose transferase-like glycosyltransferase
MLYTLCMALHDESLAKLMNTAIGAAAGVAVYNLGKLVFTPRVGLWAAAFFYTTPLTNWLSGSAYTDLFTTFFVVSQVIAFLHWRRTRQAGWICATGILMGSAVAVKLNALYAAIGVGMALVALLAASKEQWSKRVATILVCLIAAAVVAFPWYAIVYVETGNPIFPLLNGIFKSPKSSIDNTLMNAADFGVGTTWGALMRLPFRFTLDTTRFGEGLVRGAMGPLMLFLLSFGLLLLPKSSVDVRILWFVSIVFLCLWAFSFQYSRYYMAIMPVTAVLAIAGIHRASLNALTERVHRGALTILLILQVSLTPLLFWNTPERFPINLAFGMESRERFLKRTLYGYAAVLHLNKIVKPGDKVLGSGTDSLRFYVDAPLLSLGETLLNSDARRTFEMPAGPELAQALSSLGVTYIFVADAVELPYTSGEFLKTHASVVYADVEAAVYQLKAPRQE